MALYVPDRGDVVWLSFTPQVMSKPGDARR